jgi:hypothetical protein
MSARVVSVMLTAVSVMSLLVFLSVRSQGQCDVAKLAATMRWLLDDSNAKARGQVLPN